MTLEEYYSYLQNLDAALRQQKGTVVIKKQRKKSVVERVLKSKLFKTLKRRQ